MCTICRLISHPDKTCLCGLHLKSDGVRKNNITRVKKGWEPLFYYIDVSPSQALHSRSSTPIPVIFMVYLTKFAHHSGSEHWKRAINKLYREYKDIPLTYIAVNAYHQSGKWPASFEWVPAKIARLPLAVLNRAVSGDIIPVWRY